MADLLLRGGRLIDPASDIDELADVRLKDGKVDAIGRGLAPDGAEVLDVTGAVVAPGLVDLHVHLREPGREDEETIASGSAAAARGGFTAVVAMPNTDPVCDNAAVAEKVAGRGSEVAMTEVLAAGAITKGLAGEQLAAIGEMAWSGAKVRIFTDDGKCVSDTRLLRRAMEYIRGFDLICAEHCEDLSLSEGGQMNEGEFSSMLGLSGIPAAAEEIPLARDITLAKLTGVRLHVQHVSTAGSVGLIRRAKAEGVRVTAEVTPHHLVLTDSELVDFDTNFKVNPPLRSAADVQALREGLADGTIDAIATDHAPHSPEEKESEFESAPPGMVGLETALAIVLTEIVGEGRLSLPDAIRLLSTAPARIIQIEGQGGPVEAGARANLVVFDPEARWVVTEAFESLSRNSPWIGRELQGKVIHTILDGRLVVRDGITSVEVPA